MPYSYNNWPASKDRDAIGIVHFEPIPGYDFPAGIKGGDVKTVFTHLVQRLDAEVEPIEHYAPGDEWGYHYKPSANSPNLLSCHSSGTAIDYNATKHPNGRRGTWTPEQVKRVRKILADLSVDGVSMIRWLYDANRTPDEMHFEIRGSAYNVARLARRLRGQAEPAPTPSEEFTMDDEARREIAAIKEILGDLAAGIVTGVGRVNELDDDLPENTSPILRELRANQRTAIEGINEMRVKAGLRPLKIIIGYDEAGNPRFQA